VCFKPGGDPEYQLQWVGNWKYVNLCLTKGQEQWTPLEVRILRQRVSEWTKFDRCFPVANNLALYPIEKLPHVCQAISLQFKGVSCPLDWQFSKWLRSDTRWRIKVRRVVGDCNWLRSREGSKRDDHEHATTFKTDNELHLGSVTAWATHITHNPWTIDGLTAICWPVGCVQCN